MPEARAVTKKQLAMIHTLWHQRVGATDDDGREMRHAYIRSVTQGRAQETRNLSQADARLVIRQLLKDQRALLRIDDLQTAHAAGTHGRRGTSEQTEVLIGTPQIALLQDLQRALGWDQPRLSGFIERQLGVGRQIKTMRQCNKVLWGMKALLRKKEYASGIEKM